MERVIEVIDLRTGERAELVELAPEAVGVKPQYRVFSLRSVLAATLIGTPAAGAALLAMNYWRWGRVGRAWGAMLAAAGMVVVASVLTPWIPVSWRVLPWLAALELGWLMGIRILAMGLQAQAVERHVARGGGLERIWTGLAVGAVFLAGISILNSVVKAEAGPGKIVPGIRKVEARRA